jgi:Golgi phosphoprotein 3
MLNLHQELLLLSIDDDGEVEFTAGTSTFRLAFAGACMIDLAHNGHIEVDLDAVHIINPEAPSDPTLAQVISTLLQADTAQGLQYWLGKLQDDFQSLTALTLQRLTELGIISVQETKFLWVLSSRKYPVIDGQEKKEAKLRIMEALLGDGLPSQEDSELIGLAHAGGLLESFLTTREISSLEDRLASVGNLSLIAGLVAQAIVDEQEAIARAMLINPYPI